MAQTHQDVLSYRGQELRGQDGEKIGTIEEIYLDTGTREPEWAVVTTGLFGTKQTFVPLADATTPGDGGRDRDGKTEKKDAPGTDPDGAFRHEEERELHRHYGRDYNGTSGAGF